MTVMNLDATGQPLWQQQNAPVTGYGYICYPPQTAIGGDGKAYIAEPTNAGLPSLTVAYPNGYINSVEFPPSTVTNNGGPTQVNCCVGPPMVNTDGTAYVEFEVRTTNNNVITSDTLYLYNATAGSSIVLSSTTQNEALLPGPLIPDGQGGVLATWTVSSPVVQQYPYQAADVTNGVVGTPYGLPFSPQSVTPFVSPTLVLGENGTAFASASTTASINGTQVSVDEVASFNVTSGASNWTHQSATQGNHLSIVQATSGGGVTINDSSSGVIQLDMGGNTLGTAPSLQGAVPLDLATWVSSLGGTLNALWNAFGANQISTLLAQSAFPTPGGNAPGQHQPPFCQRKNVNCALAPHSDGLAGPDQYSRGIVVRRVTYWLFNLQNGTLSPLEGNSITPPPVKIEEWEANSSNPNVSVCGWLSQDDICETPDTAAGGLDGPGQITDNMGAGSFPPFTIQQQFLVDRQGVQVFWPSAGRVWYGAWGTPASSPPGFQPNQSTNTTTGWATISQINANTNAPTVCPSGCDTTLPNAGPPSP